MGYPVGLSVEQRGRRFSVCDGERWKAFWKSNQDNGSMGQWGKLDVRGGCHQGLKAKLNSHYHTQALFVGSGRRRSRGQPKGSGRERLKRQMWPLGELFAWHHLCQLGEGFCPKGRWGSQGISAGDGRVVESQRIDVVSEIPNAKLKSHPYRWLF